MRRTTLICTVGTSLFEGNLARLSKDSFKVPPNWPKIKEAFEKKNWELLAKEFLEISPTERICGAEINTIEEAKSKNWLSLENLFFLVSDTDNGRNTGKFLQKYYELRKDLSLRNIEYVVVDELQDERPKDFKIHGLRNLVRKIGEYIQRVGGPEYVAIDATGGYKAQIAIAVIIGQVLNIPVFYKHEYFSEIIDFPPLPISFDDEVFAYHADILTDFERGQVYGSDELGKIDEKLRVLLNEILVDGQKLYELNAIGQIYLTGFRIRNPKPVNLVDATARKRPTFRDDHYPTGFKEFVEKVWRENSWIVTANSLPYSKQKSIKGIGFFVKKDGEEYKLIGTYQDRNNFGARFRVHLTDESLKALTWAADTVNQKYR